MTKQGELENAIALVKTELARTDLANHERIMLFQTLAQLISQLSA